MYALNNIINVPMLSNNTINVGRTATAQAQRKNNQYDNTNVAMITGAITAATATLNENIPAVATCNIIKMYGSVTFMDYQAAAVQYFQFLERRKPCTELTNAIHLLVKLIDK
jgi:hypothetical protein